MRGSTASARTGRAPCGRRTGCTRYPGRPHGPACQVAGPEPGRVLTESDMNSSAVTTFTVFPGGGSLGRISTAWDGAGGIGGLFEQLFAPTVLRAIYAGELKRLDTCARPPFPVSPPHTVGGRSGRLGSGGHA